MESNHHFSFNRGRKNAADVPSFTRRIARSAIPFVSERWGVGVRWFHENSSQDLPNSQKKSVWMTFGFCDGSRNFRRLCSVSSEFLFLHGQDCIHWVARSCTTTAYRWLFRDWRPSLRTLCSAVIKSPYFSARRMDLFRFLRESEHCASV